MIEGSFEEFINSQNFLASTPQRDTHIVCGLISNEFKSLECHSLQEYWNHSTQPLNMLSLIYLVRLVYKPTTKKDVEWFSMTEVFNLILDVIKDSSVGPAFEEVGVNFVKLDSNQKADPPWNIISKITDIIAASENPNTMKSTLMSAIKKNIKVPFNYFLGG